MATATMSEIELQKEIFDKISNNDTIGLKTLLSSFKVKIQCVDEHGMSPLQYACFKGNKEIAQMLLDQGADVNFCQHEHAYTALHFGALSGDADLCNLLMSHGAKITSKNSVGRTAAQMAAFVGLRTEPMLPPHLADSFHKFIMQVNVHPVRIAMTLQKCLGLVDNLEKIHKVLESMRQREMTRGADTNEVMAFKYHYLSCVVQEVIKCQKLLEARKNDNNLQNDKIKTTDPIEFFIRKLLKHNSKNDIKTLNFKPEYQELFLRETVREFPFRESTIFRQMVATLAGTDPPSASSVVSAAINGQRAFVELSQMCVTCGEDKANKKCSKCKAVQYCDRECQRLHWFLHKKECTRLEQPSIVQTNNTKIIDADDKIKIADAIKHEIDNLTIK
ncbi:ankyrin repeat and MYND domain-containing protein 2 isoform X2 [Aphidius gifuensis]|uniref:ankyrin repeat and MYND domain-containing protein 2 isoform X2 n=1 Tax=Aphidius gifuensis TaxID=684658 RepID=UPI001CDD36D4|nr:ankyrin repeat and MYND domain-containing protein 2 isoform X2 [Aphidius gifuensis]